MSDPLKLLNKCKNEKCGDIVSKDELKKVENELKMNVKKKCGQFKIKNNLPNKVKCELKVYSKSKFYKLQRKNLECFKDKCKKEKENFLKEFTKNMKKNRKTLKNKKNKNNKNSNNLQKSKKSNKGKKIVKSKVKKTF